MEEFMIKSGRVRGCQHAMAGYARTMRNKADDLDRIRRALRGKISSAEQLGERLRFISTIMEEQAVHFDTMGEKADVIAGLYEQAEKKILGEKEDSPWDINSLLSDLLEATGTMGTGLSTVASWFDKESWEDPIQLALDTAGSAVDMASSIIDMEDWKSIEEWLETGKYWDWDGLGDIAGDVADLDAWDAFKTKFSTSLQHEAKDSVSFVTDSGWSKALGIAGTVLSIGSTAYGNYQEWKSGEISGWRAVAETAGEVVVDWGIGIAATAAAAALLPVGAPAVAVGAVAAGVTWLADCVCESFTGKGLTETISDAALDVGTALWDAGTAAVNVIGDGLSDFGGAVSDWWGSLW